MKDESDFCLSNIGLFCLCFCNRSLSLGDSLMDSLLLIAALALPITHSSAFDAPTIRQAQIKAPCQGESIDTRAMIATNAPEDSGAQIAYTNEQ